MNTAGQSGQTSWKYPRALAFGIGTYLLGTILWDTTLLTLGAAVAAAIFGLILDHEKHSQT